MSDSPQFIRTDKAIRQALISLLKNKPFEKITVQDILDETPVTRSTFYKHYHDKYEIVERMQGEFFVSQLEIRKILFENPTAYTSFLKKNTEQNREIMEALLKVRTENVDFRQSLAAQAERFYLEGSVGANPKIEANVFAQAVTAFQLSPAQPEDFTFEFMHDVWITVFLRLIGLNDDEETYKFIKRKLNNKKDHPKG